MILCACFVFCSVGCATDFCAFSQPMPEDAMSNVSLHEAMSPLSPQTMPLTPTPLSADITAPGLGREAFPSPHESGTIIPTINFEPSGSQSRRGISPSPIRRVSKLLGVGGSGTIAENDEEEEEERESLVGHAHGEEGQQHRRGIVKGIGGRGPRRPGGRRDLHDHHSSEESAGSMMSAEELDRHIADAV
jgi:hypothetical protein